MEIVKIPARILPIFVSCGNREKLRMDFSWLSHASRRDFPWFLILYPQFFASCEYEIYRTFAAGVLYSAYTYFAILRTLMCQQAAIDRTAGGFFPPKYWWNQMESGSKNSLASTYDNVEAIWKRILIFLSNTLDNINVFEGEEGKVV